MLEHYMMSIIISGFLLVAFGLVMISKADTLTKFAVAICIITSSAIVYRSTNSYYGKPKVLTENIQKAWVMGFHPVPSKGVTFLWLRKPGKLTPISYRIPYSKNVHRTLEKLRRKYKGRPFKIAMKGGGSSLIKPFNKGNSPTIMELPPTLPRKNIQQGG
jgi:hypothetical protein